MLCHTIGTIGWDIANHYSSCTCRSDVNIIITRCQLSNILQFRQLLEHFFCDIHLIDEYSVSIFCTFNDVFLSCSFVYRTISELLYWLPREVAWVDCMAVEND